MVTVNVDSRLPIGDVLFRLVGLPPTPLALKAWIAGLLPLLHTAEEALIGGIQILKFGLKRNRIHFFQPQQLLFQGSQHFVLLESCGGLAGGLVFGNPLGEKMVVYEPGTAESFLNKRLLFSIWI